MPSGEWSDGINIKLAVHNERRMFGEDKVRLFNSGIVVAAYAKYLFLKHFYGAFHRLEKLTTVWEKFSEQTEVLIPKLVLQWIAG